jgi:predicted MFS family arabinose efflux permease
MVSAWTAFFIGLPLFLSALFQLDTAGIGFLYFLIGLSNIVSMLFVQPYILKLFSLKKTVIYSALFCTLFLLMLIVIPLLSAISVCLIIFTLIELLTYSSFLAVFSNAVTHKEQGKTMGGSASVSSAATLISTMGAVQLANFGTRLPIILSAFLFFFIAILMIKYKPLKDS